MRRPRNLALRIGPIVLAACSASPRPASRATSVAGAAKGSPSEPIPAHAEADVAPANAELLAKTAPASADKAAPRDKRARMGAIAYFAYIYKRPEAKGLALGYIRMGTSVA